MTAALDLRSLDLSRARYTITMHAIRRYRERIDLGASDVAARDAILRALSNAYVERVLDENTVQIRARGRRWPGRIRLRARPCAGHLLEIVTVLPEHDGAKPRKPHPRGAHRGRVARRYERGESVGPWLVLRFIGKQDGSGALMYQAQCACGRIMVKTTHELRRDARGCRSCAHRRTPPWTSRS